MITNKQLDDWRVALHNFVLMSNENDNIEKKRTGVLSIKTEIEQEYPYVKEYEPYPDFGVLNYTTSLFLCQGFISEVESFVEREYETIKEYEHLDKKTIEEYAAKLEQYKQTESVRYTDRLGPHPDQIFTQHGTYRKFCAYQDNKTYLLALKLRKDLEKKGEDGFHMQFKLLMLYNAACNDLLAIEKTMRRMGYLIADTSVQTRDEVKKEDPYADVKPFRNPEADPYIYYNFWGASFRSKQEQYAGKKSLTGEQRAVILANYNLRKLEYEFERIFQAAQADIIGEVPEATKRELEKLLSKLLNDFVERVGQDFGTSFDVISDKLSNWENRTVNASHNAEDKVPTIICHDDESDGECSSSCLQKFIDTYCHEWIQNYLQSLAFAPRNKEIGILLYDFWGDDYERMAEQYRGKRGLPDELRALYKQEDDTNLLLARVKEYLDQAIDECAKNGTRVGTREMSRTLAKVKSFFQDLFFKYNDKLDSTDLSSDEKLNASLGWIYFTRRQIGRVRWMGVTYTNPPPGMKDMRGLYFTFCVHGCGEIFDEMKRRFLEDSEVEVNTPPTHNYGLFSPSGNQVLKFDRLYEFLHRADERVILVSQSDFEYAVYNADFNQIFKDAATLKSTTKVKCLIQFLRDKFPDNWYDAVSQNCGIKKDSLKKINYERDTLRLFKRCLEGILIT